MSLQTCWNCDFGTRITTRRGCVRQTETKCSGLRVPPHSLAPADLLTSRSVRSSRMLGIGERCRWIGTHSYKQCTSSVVYLLYLDVRLKISFVSIPSRGWYFSYRLFFFFHVRRKGGRHGEGWWAFNLSEASEVRWGFFSRRIMCQPYGLPNSVLLFTAVRFVYI